MSAAILTGLPLAGTDAASATSRVFVVAYPCVQKDTGPVVASGPPTLDLYDQAFYGDSGTPVSFAPVITVTKQTEYEVDFYFDVKPGNYSAFLTFPTREEKSICGRNGPLIVLPAKDRHLFIAATTGVADWHFPAAVAGILPIKGIGVSVLVYDHPMHCGDDVRSFDPKTHKLTVAPSSGIAVVDDGAYYQNVHVYGKQDHTVAIQVYGALFTTGTILLTDTPDVRNNKPPFIMKDITGAILHAATAKPFDQKLVCINGF